MSHRTQESDTTQKIHSSPTIYLHMNTCPNEKRCPFWLQVLSCRERKRFMKKVCSTAGLNRLALVLRRQITKWFSVQAILPALGGIKSTYKIYNTIMNFIEP